MPLFSWNSEYDIVIKVPSLIKNTFIVKLFLLKNESYALPYNSTYYNVVD